MEISWTEELDKAYNDSKLALKNIGPLYLPKRTDRLAMTLDWSKSGMGATMFALLKDRKVVVAYFSATLSGNQSRWPPCDGEALIACIAIDRFSHYIREATQPTLVCSDSKPVVQAVFLLMNESSPHPRGSTGFSVTATPSPWISTTCRASSL